MLHGLLNHLSMLSEINSDIVREHAQETHSLVQKCWISDLIEAYRLRIVFKSPDGSRKLSNTVNIMNVQLDISLSVWPKRLF